MRRWARRAPDALGIGLRRATVVRHRRLAARHRSYREGVRVRRNDGAQGVTAALVVQTGWNGVDDIFSGADNFFRAYAPNARPERLVEKLGERYEIAATDIKKWTVGSPIQGPLDALDA